MRKTILLILVLALAGCGGAAGTETPAGGASPANIGLNPALEAGKSVQVGEAMPELTFELAGAPVKLSDYRGKTVVLNFWATWCGPCRVEMPDFEALGRSRDDVVFIGINKQENESAVAKFAAEVGVTFPLVLDRSGDIAAGFGVLNNLPTTFFIDAAGVVQKSQVGAMTRSQISKYLDDMAAK
ncbi:MAG TPA: TlpA disulfide reductase family protein [Herpetosiphonaceae bacterium]|nr:TlpA disulfide reductase family protein [Herpetosiphonaceae bacterium]